MVLISLPPGYANARQLRIPIQNSISLRDALEIASATVEFLRALLEGNGTTADGTFLLLLNGKKVAIEQATDILVSDRDELVIIPPILGG